MKPSDVGRAVPRDFAGALKERGPYEFFTRSPYVHHAGDLSWIGATSRRATRRRRIQQAMLRLLAQQEEEIAAANVRSKPIAAGDHRKSA